ncbi:methionyl-tRNA formyltransferase, partial [Pseudokineococcus basanitobsidens]|uniref:methionyl-tRNA formyltransferase n=1 Tax=Pseudokineococcus basanitobsidens TaxID=1926649 RepID=UPI0030D8C01D
MRVVLAGTPEPAVPALRALLASRHDVVGVLTRPDARAGRGRRSVTSPVKALALEAGLPVLAPARPGDPEALSALAGLAPDCVPVVAYGALVPRAALDLPPHGWVNLHFSLLPRWGGG